MLGGSSEHLALVTHEGDLTELFSHISGGLLYLWYVFDND